MSAVHISMLPRARLVPCTYLRVGPACNLAQQIITRFEYDKLQRQCGVSEYQVTISLHHGVNDQMICQLRAIVIINPWSAEIVHIDRGQRFFQLEIIIIVLVSSFRLI